MVAMVVVAAALMVRMVLVVLMVLVAAVVAGRSSARTGPLDARTRDLVGHPEVLQVGLRVAVVRVGHVGAPGRWDHHL